MHNFFFGENKNFSNRLRTMNGCTMMTILTMDELDDGLCSHYYLDLNNTLMEV